MHTENIQLVRHFIEEDPHATNDIIEAIYLYINQFNLHEIIYYYLRLKKWDRAKKHPSSSNNMYGSY